MITFSLILAYMPVNAKGGEKSEGERCRESLEHHATIQEVLAGTGFPLYVTAASQESSDM